MLHGREVERDIVAALLADSRAGRAGSIVVRGEAGVGKSALVDEAVRSVQDMVVLRTVGLESESPLAFAALHRLLRPVLHLRDALPGPQVRALRVAFGEEDGPGVEPFLIAIATLTLLTEAAERTPVLCLVDDAHWLDVASADALLFTARRLGADRVAMIFCARDGDAASLAAEDLPTIRLGSLDTEAARALMAERTGQDLPLEVVATLRDRTGGNPLGLAELTSTLTADQLTGVSPIPGTVHLTAAVERVFLDRARRLPRDVQTVLLLAAADDSGSVAVIRRAAHALGADPSAIEQAERSDLLVTDGTTVRVRHPLVRSAILQAATAHERRTAHRAIADVLDGSHDPDRLAWHRAAAVDGPDAAAATGLEAAARRAERRGGYAAAAAAYERAAELTTDGEVRAARLCAAARNAWASGRSAHAGHLADEARAIADDRLLRADIDRLRGRIEVNTGSAAQAYRIFTRAARAVAADDPTRAVEMWVAASLTHQFDHGVAALPTELPATLPAPGAMPRERCLAHLLAATTADIEGRVSDALRSHAAAMAVSGDVEDLDVLANLGNAALHLGDDRAHRQCFTRMLSIARNRGAVMSVLYALPRLAIAHQVAGEWDSVRESADEALGLSADIGQRALGAAPVAWLALLAALRGSNDYGTLRVRLDAAIGDHVGVLTDFLHDLSRWAAGIDQLNAGEAHAAVEHLRHIRLPTLARMAAYDRFDAAIRAGATEIAGSWLDDVAAFADASGWPWALATADHGRAVLADPADALVLFESALRHHAGSGRRHDRARTELAYGELLRRSQRRVDARVHLRAALGVLEDLGAGPLADRARRELRASGETARKRDPSTLTALTPMERQITALVAQGLSNREVAEQCWISPRTVAFHLRNVFTKTGVTSRGELTRIHGSGLTPAEEYSLPSEARPRRVPR